MSQPSVVGSDQHSLDSKLTVTEDAVKAPIPSPGNPQPLIQLKLQKARKTFPPSNPIDKQQHELKLAETLSLNLSHKEIEHTSMLEKVPAPHGELNPSTDKQRLLNLMKNEFDTPVGKSSNETNKKDLPIVLRQQEAVALTNETCMNIEVPNHNQVTAECLSVKASPEEASDLKVSSNLQVHSQSEEDVETDVMDVEAAIAALHGEVLEDSPICKIFKVTSIPAVADDEEDSIDQNTVAPVEDSVNRPSSKKVNGKKRKGRLSSSLKMRSFSTTKDELATSATPSPSVDSAAPKTTSSSRRRTVARRELNGLFIDEGAIHMLCEMEKRGRSGRRSGSFNETACLIPKELLGDKILKNIRTTRMQRVIEKKQPLPVKSPSPSEDDVPNRLAFPPTSITTPQTTNATNGDTTSPAVASLTSSSHSTISSPISRPEAAAAAAAAPAPTAPKKMKISHTGPASITDLPASLDFELNAFSKDFTQFNLNAAESGISKTTETTLSHYVAECREIVVRLNEPLVHIVLCPKSSLSPGAINPSMLHELTQLLRLLNSQDSIRIVLFTSAGPDFCTGIDLALLISHSQSDRLQAANRMAGLIKDFVLALMNCDKLLVAGLTGSVVGLGVTILPYFDVVYASDKATFHLPYVQLGQSTEGGLPLTFHNYAASNQLIGVLYYEGRCLTATEAQGHGLVHTVLWPSSFQDDLLTRIHRLLTQTTKQCLVTKQAIRASLRRDLPAALLEESQLLVKTWISDEFQTRALNHIGATKSHAES